MGGLSRSSVRHIQLDVPIKAIGVYTVSVAPHPEVEVKITVNVARLQRMKPMRRRAAKFSPARLPTALKFVPRAEALFESEAELPNDEEAAS